MDSQLWWQHDSPGKMPSHTEHRTCDTMNRYSHYIYFIAILIMRTLSDQDEFFAMKKASIDDTLDEQTIRQILADKRRELELPIRGPR